ncbi:peroxiredoxin family protein [Chryseobacterium viscerum]|uniref:peroxiredoxin family protein n=1 Tax=Chryseobacterium viscerum TaxID=1037377 RepID=UPI000CCE36E3|nr:redoxin domain-containing protein [Chryseobacterium viscerum]
MNKIVSFMLCSLCCWSYAQKIDLYFPHFAGKTYDFIIFQGDKQQTLVQGTIPEDGKFTLSIPKEYAPYTGMSRWLITNSKEGGGLDMLIPGKDFSVSCQEAMPSEKNIIYQGNTQNQQLNELYKQQQDIFARHDAMLQATRSYPKTDKSYPAFQQEYETQKKDYKMFQASLGKDPDYAKALIRIINATQGIGTELFDNESQKADNIARYIASEMDPEVLYTSGYWTNVISAWVGMHTQVLQDPYRFVEDFSRLSSKITDKKKYTDFVGRTTHYLNEQGKDQYIAGITPWVLSSGKMTHYEGSLAVYLKGAVGSQAPDLVFTKHIGNPGDHNHETTTLKSSELAGNEYQKTLLIFYESGCGPCENLLQQLPGNYELLQKQGIRIVSVSADKEVAVFKSKSDHFPWKKDAFCDYEGIKGTNFMHYAVAGTPTMFLLDKTGKIILRTASLQEVLAQR